MYRLLKFAICFILVSFSTVSAQSKGWRGIVPLQTGRAEVELVLGVPSKQADHYAFYEFSNEVVTISYAVDKCENDRGRGWNVPRGTVVEITVSPRKVMNVAELQLEPGKFKKEINDHFPDESFYRNDNEGYGVVTIRDKVTSLRYYPSEKQKHCRCIADVQKKPPESPRTQPTAEEKAALDRFMTRLDQETGSPGWIRIDTAKRSANDSNLADMVYQFLKEKYRSQIKRVSVMGGAFSLHEEIEFFMIRPNGKAIPFRP